MKKKKLLITDASRFEGSNLATKLLKKILLISEQENLNIEWY